MELKKIVETIFQIEEDLDLFNKKIDGIYFWELVRFKVVSQIAQETGVYGQPHTKFDFNSESVSKYIFNAVKNIFCKNPFFSPNTEILFLGHPRRKLMDDGFWWDIYCDPVIESLTKTYNCLLLEKPFLNTHLSPPKTHNIRYLDLALFLSAVLRKSKLLRVSWNENDKKTLDETEQYICDELGSAIALKKIVYSSLLTNKSTLPIYSSLLKKIRPRVVIILVSYGKEIFIQACKNLNIPTVELQHGTISRYHTAYSFPGSKSFKPSFPDYFFAFGEYWKKSVDFPIPQEKNYSVGYPFFEMETAKYNHEPKKNQIIFISQGTIGDKMSRFAVELKARQDFAMDIVYKLHPGEYARWKKEYPWLVDSGIKVIDDDSEPLYRLLAQSKALVGVSSTVVYEGLGMGLRTFLMDLPGIEYMDDLIDSQAATLVFSVDELIQKLHQHPEGDVKTDHFFKPNALENIKNALDEIVEFHSSKVNK
ncbi:MAG: hypothetical protein K9J79_08770 [Desulfobacteraceae bacterium]|nr:hypothetical protein [Desulfobacteraceae bacterium]